MAKVLDKVLLRRLKCRRGHIDGRRWVNRLSGFQALVFRDRYSVVQEFATVEKITCSIMRYTISKHSESVFGSRPEGWVSGCVRALMKYELDRKNQNA